MRPHDLRHTFATRELNAGKQPQWVSWMLGHSSIDITIDIYGRTNAAQLRKHLT